MRIQWLAVFMTYVAFNAPVSAGFIDASAVVTSQLDADKTNFDYTITLTNSSASTDSIGTFWFSWVPGKDFLDTSPISESSPANWVAKVTHAGSSDGFAIQWVSSLPSANVGIGDSLTFGFKSSETPAQLAGDSPFFPGTPEGTSVLYNAAPFSADSQQIVVSAVPEPPTMMLSLVGCLGIVLYRRIR